MNTSKTPGTNQLSFGHFWGRYLLWIIAAFLIFSYFYRPYDSRDTKEVSYTEFKSFINKEKVSKVTIKGNVITGTF